MYTAFKHDGSHTWYGTGRGNEECGQQSEWCYDGIYGNEYGEWRHEYQWNSDREPLRSRQQEQQVQKEQNQANGQNPQAGEPKNLQNKAAAPAAGGEIASWTCSCGQVNNGRFCIECGKPKPQDDDSWTCMERSTKKILHGVWKTNAEVHTTAAINVAGNRKILQILRNSVRSAEIRLQMTR